MDATLKKELDFIYFNLPDEDIYLTATDLSRKYGISRYACRIKIAIREEYKERLSKSYIDSLKSSNEDDEEKDDDEDKEDDEEDGELKFAKPLSDPVKLENVPSNPNTEIGAITKAIDAIMYLFRNLFIILIKVWKLYIIYIISQ